MTIQPVDRAIWAGSAVRHGHAVQFYENEDFLYGMVSDFLADGLAGNEPLVIIATEPHRDAFAAGLTSKGFDAEELRRSGRLALLDARETIEAFMDGTLPDEQKFKAIVGGTIARLANGGSVPVRAYGEMVDVLWRDGQPDAAIRVEELWNDLATSYTFKLLCAYPIGNFYRESHGRQFDEICRRHGQVIPTESFIEAADTENLSLEIAMLQQRAQALTAEIEHRKELEKSLREALSARQQAEKALRQNEQQLKDFVENATIGLHWVGPDGTILWANNAELKFLGYTREEYIGRNIAEFHVDESTIHDILRRLAANEEIHDYEARLKARDGTIKHVAISSNVLFEDGTFVHTRCFTRDITAEKRLEEERAFLLDATAILNHSLDYETRLHELAQLIVPRLADRCAVDIVRDDDTLVRVSVTSDDDGERAIDAAVEHVIRNGVPNAGDDRLTVPMTTGDKTIGAITFVSTSSRRYSAADLALAMELARRAAIAIENSRLFRMAQEGNRAKEEFLATLSHELRTPLTAILGWSRMLRTGPLEPEMMQTALETIERSARMQAALIDDILDLSRVVTGKLSLQMELVDLTSTVEASIETVRLAANGKNVNIDFGRGTAPIFVNGDATRLQQIVWNLLSNAIKFSHSGGRVTVQMERTRSTARLIVRDEGAGIRLDFLPHVFEPFRQAEAATTRKYGGLGLGLAIVKYFAELHGGSVSAESAGEGHGATFVVTLPLAQEPRIEPPRESASATDLRGTSILVVDDDDDTRAVISALLQGYGASVEAAASVAQACSILQRRRPDVLVTDIAMPHQDGFALLRFLRSSDGPARGVPVIALTALGGPEDEASILAAGFQAFARKPLEPLQFATTIARLREGNA